MDVNAPHVIELVEPFTWLNRNTIEPITKKLMTSCNING
jgi:hypothetical protein